MSERTDWRRLAEQMAVSYYLLVLADDEFKRHEALDQLKETAREIGTATAEQVAGV